MRRAIFLLILAILAISTLLWAQSTAGVVLRTAMGDRQITMLEQAGQTYFAADEVLGSFGARIERDGRGGFRTSLSGATGAFGTDSRFAVANDDLVEMPVPAIVIEERAFVPVEFFRGFFRKSGNLDVKWDAPTRVLQIKPAEPEEVSSEISVVDLQGITKIVIQLSSRADFSIVRQRDIYVIQTRQPIKPPFAEQTYENQFVRKISVGLHEVQIHLTTPEVAGNSYKLDSPFRIVLDLKAGPAPVPGVAQPGGGGVRLQATDLPGIRTIVLDPGHGGKESGAVGPKGLLEKETTLAICKKLAAMLGSRLRARVILTREDDSLVSLDQRTAIANQYKADLFLSVHVNASLTKGAHGSETYFLSLDASDELARRAAEHENRISVQSAPTGATDLRLILWELAQQEYLQESSALAESVQVEMNSATGVKNRGVKQAPFKVLVGATMPAALVEVGFISNPEEEKKLRSDEFQSTLANALFRAILRYKSDYETRIGVALPSAPPAKASGGGPAAPSDQPATGTASVPKVSGQ